MIKSKHTLIKKINILLLNTFLVYIVIQFQFINIIYWQKLQMSSNKNVADYTDFTGQKFLKKIVQAPGGQSNFSIGWTNQKTDYGTSSRNPKTLEKQRQHHEEKTQQDSYNSKLNSPYQYLDPNYYKQNSKYIQKQPTSNQPIGGEYGYGNYAKQINYNTGNRQKQEGTYAVNGGYTYSNHQDQIDIAKRQYQDQKRKKYEKQQESLINNKRPPSNQTNQTNSTDDRACIKIRGAPKSQITFGDNNYNYWTDNSNQNSINKNQNNKVNNYYDNHLVNRKQQYEYQQPVKTSVKVHNPPGGKSNFQLG